MTHGEDVSGASTDVRTNRPRQRNPNIHDQRYRSPDNPGPDNPGPDNPGPDNPGPDNPGPDNRDPDDPGAGDASAAELTERVMRVAHLIRRSAMANLAPLDLTPAQSRALRTISKSEQPIRMGELAAHLGVVPRSATGLVDALQQSGLVERAVDPANRRSVLVTLTEPGRDRQRAMVKARAAIGDGLFGELTPTERRTLADLLGRVQSVPHGEL